MSSENDATADLSIWRYLSADLLLPLLPAILLLGYALYTHWSFQGQWPVSARVQATEVSLRLSGAASSNTLPGLELSHLTVSGRADWTLEPAATAKLDSRELAGIEEITIGRGGALTIGRSAIDAADAGGASAASRIVLNGIRFEKGAQIWLSQGTREKLLLHLRSDEPISGSFLVAGETPIPANCLACIVPGMEAGETLDDDLELLFSSQAPVLRFKTVGRAQLSLLLVEGPDTGRTIPLLAGEDLPTATHLLFVDDSGLHSTITGGHVQVLGLGAAEESESTIQLAPSDWLRVGAEDEFEIRELRLTDEGLSLLADGHASTLQAGGFNVSENRIPGPLTFARGRYGYWLDILVGIGGVASGGLLLFRLVSRGRKQEQTLDDAENSTVSTPPAPLAPGAAAANARAALATKRGPNLAPRQSGPKAEDQG